MCIKDQLKKIKIFISYAREDFEIAEKLYNDLLNAGLSPWLDQKNLLPGQNWRLTIKKNIKNSNFFIALLSANSVSKKGFVQKELKIALDLLDEFPPEDIFIIPVLIDECMPTHEKLQNLHWADISHSYKTGFNQILNVLIKDYNETVTIQNNEYVENILKKQINVNSLTIYSKWKFPKYSIDRGNYLSRLITDLKKNSYETIKDIENIVESTKDIRDLVAIKQKISYHDDAINQIRLALVLGDENYMWNCHSKPISIKVIAKYALYKDQDDFNRRKQPYLS